MNAKELKQMQTPQLKEKLVQLRTDLVKLNGSVATGAAPKNAGQIRTMRKSIARILTELRTREVPANG
ncbi:MAG TPA: 50S ribosomal protein L29 [Acidobacteriota bacterium]|nr:50S ribosomal protein L29 [Acidobacteriota bacterium]